MPAFLAFTQGPREAVVPQKWGNLIVFCTFIFYRNRGIDFRFSSQLATEIKPKHGSCCQREVTLRCHRSVTAGHLLQMILTCPELALPQGFCLHPACTKKPHRACKVPRQGSDWVRRDPGPSRSPQKEATFFHNAYLLLQQGKILTVLKGRSQCRSNHKYQAEH